MVGMTTAPQIPCPPPSGPVIVNPAGYATPAPCVGLRLSKPVTLSKPLQLASSAAVLAKVKGGDPVRKGVLRG